MKVGKQILLSFLQIIEGISDKEYQKRAWIKGEEADFGENICLLSDLGDPIIENCKDFGITEKQYALLIKFRAAFELFTKKHDWPPEFIDTSEWTQITEMAKGVLQAFNYTPLKKINRNKMQP